MKKSQPSKSKSIESVKKTVNKQEKNRMMPVNHFHFILLMLLIDFLLFFIVVTIVPFNVGVPLALLLIMFVDLWLIGGHLEKCEEHDNK